MAKTKPPSKQEVMNYASEAARSVGLPPSWELAILDAESGYDPAVGLGQRKSSAGAVGYGQLMPATARGLGVDPYDWRENILGSARYLKQQYDRFHSLPLAASAYNSGPGGSEAQGQVENIAETKVYVAKVAELEKQYRNLGGAEPFAGLQTPQGQATSSPQPAPPPKFGLTPDSNYLSALGALGPLSARVANQASLFQPSQQAQETPQPQEVQQKPFTPQSSSISPINYENVIGVPNQGTHTLYSNWESDNAVDLSAPVGSPVYARQSGTIGDQIGPLDSKGDPRLQGERLHLVTKSNEYYYAHLSKIVVKAGQKVKKGELLGYSGEANGVAHLHFAAKNGDPLQMVRKES